MKDVIAAAKLHLNKREASFLIPLYVVLTAGVIAVIIAFVFMRFGSVPGSAEWIESSRSNPGFAYALAGYLVYLGVQAVATTFPFGMTLGVTRRAYTAGTLVWAVIVSAFLAFVFAVLLGLELVTGHWFVGFYVIDIFMLGAGNIWLLLPVVFLGSLTLLLIGAVFGAAWLRLRAYGPLIVTGIVVVLLLLALLWLIPYAASIAAAFQLWWLAVAAVGVLLVCSVALWLQLRGATVR